MMNKPIGALTQESTIVIPSILRTELVRFLEHVLTPQREFDYQYRRTLLEILRAAKPLTDILTETRLKNYEAVLKALGASEMIAKGEIGFAEIDAEEVAWAADASLKHARADGEASGE